jgi:arsenate reductase (thioredoxin)
MDDTDMTAKLKILFLCTGNSCRSQMAEGWARSLKSDCVEAYSAGTDIHGMNPNVIKVMSEAGVDISSQRSKHLDELGDIVFDYVVTVCGAANEACPIFSGGAKVVHVGFEDPPQLAAQCESDEAKLDCYRRVRDQIRDFIASLPEGLQQESCNCGN